MMQRLRTPAIIASILAVLVVTVAWQGSARASTVGPNFPTVSANDASIGSVAWTNLTALTAFEGNDAGVTLGKNAVSNYLMGSSFGFAIPSSSQINGIQLEIYSFETDGTTKADLVDSSVFLMVGGVVSGTNHGANASVGTSGSWHSYGGASDTWGLTLTGADVNATNFGAAMSYSNQSSGAGGSESANVDAMRITITYTVPNAAPAAPTLSGPADGATGVSTSPVFTLNSTDAENDYLQYHIDLYASDCSTLIAIIDQTTSQTGWSGQDQAGGTAYTGSSTLASSTLATYTYTGPLAASTTYCWSAIAIDPAGSNVASAASATRTFTTATPNATPAAPVLSQPADTATGVALKPVFKLATTDADNDPVQYSIDLCADSACSSVINTFDQTIDATGWSGQDASSGTAFSTGTSIGTSRTATYTYFSTALSPATTYWWRARARAVSGNTTWTAYSSISSFTTASASTTLKGGMTITGGVNIY